MKFSTIILGQKRNSVVLKSNTKYDMFTVFPDLSFIKHNNIFCVDTGEKFFDLIGDQGPLVFVSESFKNLLEENDIKGLDFFQIIIEGVEFKYYCYVVKKEFNSICEYDEDGDFINGTIQVDLSSWDGKTDIFSIKDSGATVCSPRVRAIIEKAKMTNIEFNYLSDY